MLKLHCRWKLGTMDLIVVTGLDHGATFTLHEVEYLLGRAALAELYTRGRATVTCVRPLAMPLPWARPEGVAAD